jgi:hypothetical protein
LHAPGFWLHSSSVVSAPRAIQSRTMSMTGCGSASPACGIGSPGPSPRSFFMRKLLSGSPGFTRSIGFASASAASLPTRLR